VGIQEANLVCCGTYIVGERAMNQIDCNISCSRDVATNYGEKACLKMLQAEESHAYLRSTTANIRSKSFLAFNPPTSPENVSTSQCSEILENNPDGLLFGH
jgi:hypothetical protein